MTDAKRVSILLIDDDEGDVELLRMLLEEEPPWPLDVEHCLDAKQARGRLGAGTAPDIILLDYLIGAETGLELLNEIRDGSCKTTPVVLLTGHGDEEVAVEAMKRGASDYLVKGRISRSGLLRSIMNALDKARLEREVEEQRQALIEAERRRAMMDTVVAACHHLSGPLTVLISNLELLSELEGISPEHGQLMRQCRLATQQAAQVLEKLRELRAYRTKTYLGDTTMVDLGLTSEGHGDPQ